MRLGGKQALKREGKTSSKCYYENLLHLNGWDKSKINTHLLNARCSRHVCVGCRNAVQHANVRPQYIHYSNLRFVHMLLLTDCRQQSIIGVK